jgi:hypothetical protein
MAVSLSPGRSDNLALLPCRPTTYSPLGVTMIYGRHIFLGGEVGSACKCGRYHVLDWQNGTTITDVPNREVEVIVVAGAA